MKLFSFVNTYLSPGQKGLQTAHAAVEMMLMDRVWDDMDEDLKNWASNHRTIIIKDGGNCKRLEEIIVLFEEGCDAYQWSYFREDKESLNNALTAVCIILPKKFYMPAQDDWTYTDHDKQIMELLRTTKPSNL